MEASTAHRHCRRSTPLPRVDTALLVRPLARPLMRKAPSHPAPRASTPRSKPAVLRAHILAGVDQVDECVSARDHSPRCESAGTVENAPIVLSPASVVKPTRQLRPHPGYDRPTALGTGPAYKRCSETGSERTLPPLSSCLP
ncbi:hypothetical protein GCM10023317_29010 [Actinopolymorpha pittospori]